MEPHRIFSLSLDTRGKISYEDEKERRSKDYEMAVDFCDLNCRYASWPKDQALDGSGSCRTFQAVYCGKKKRSVYKNAPCMEKEKRSGSPSQTKRTPKEPQ